MGNSNRFVEGQARRPTQTGLSVRRDLSLQTGATDNDAHIPDALGKASVPTSLLATDANSVTEEYRADVDGQARTKKQFFGKYGKKLGARQWAAAELPPPPTAPSISDSVADERRIDVDGQARTQKQFLDKYGDRDGARQWAAAELPLPPTLPLSLSATLTVDDEPSTQVIAVGPEEDVKSKPLQKYEWASGPSAPRGDPIDAARSKLRKKLISRQEYIKIVQTIERGARAEG